MPTTPNTNSPSPVLPNPADATNAVASAEIPDIRGLKDMVDIPTGNEWVLWLFVAAAALVVAGGAAWFVRRRLARRSVELAPSPPPPPLGVVPRDVVYRREAGTAPPMPPCGRW